MSDVIKQQIRDLLKEHNAVLLAHNYMRDEVQEIADITGDSLALLHGGGQDRCRCDRFLRRALHGRVGGHPFARQEGAAAPPGCRLPDGRHGYGRRAGGAARPGIPACRW